MDPQAQAMTLIATNTDVAITGGNPIFNISLAKCTFQELGRPFKVKDLVYQTVKFKCSYSLTDSFDGQSHRHQLEQQQLLNLGTSLPHRTPPPSALPLGRGVVWTDTFKRGDRRRDISDTRDISPASLQFKDEVVRCWHMSFDKLRAVQHNANSIAKQAALCAILLLALFIIVTVFL